MLVGVLDLAANAMFAIASTKGLLSVVAVLGSLYPVTTVLLARAPLLGERVRRVQEAGIVLALRGGALIAGGGAGVQPHAEEALELGNGLGGRGVVHGRHAQLARRLEVARQVVDEDALRGLEADRLGAELVDRRLGLAHPDLAGDHDAVEEHGNCERS